MEVAVNVQYMEPLNHAWNRMKIALFRPFDIHKWFVVGFNAFLAGLMEASNGGSGARVGNQGTFREFLYFPRTAWDWLMSHPGWAIAILFAIVVAVIVIVVLTWVSSRGVFMFLESVVRDRVEIAKPWREYHKEGNSLFVWRLFLGIASFAAFGLIIGFFFARGADLYANGIDSDIPIAFFLGVGLVTLAVVLVWGYIALFLKDFVAPLMYKNRISCGAAWKIFLGIFRKNPFPFIGYGILIFLLMIAFAVAVIFAGLATCCIGFILLVIPYISTIVTLPVWYTYRAFSLEFLAQFGPEYDVFRRQGAGEAAAPTVPVV
jgi:hypothetical protein